MDSTPTKPSPDVQSDLSSTFTTRTPMETCSWTTSSIRPSTSSRTTLDSLARPDSCSSSSSDLESEGSTSPTSSCRSSRASLDSRSVASSSRERLLRSTSSGSQEISSRTRRRSRQSPDRQRTARPRRLIRFEIRTFLERKIRSQPYHLQVFVLFIWMPFFSFLFPENVYIIYFLFSLSTSLFVLCGTGILPAAFYVFERKISSCRVLLPTFSFRNKKK